MKQLYPSLKDGSVTPEKLSDAFGPYIIESGTDGIWAYKIFSDDSVILEGVYEERLSPIATRSDFRVYRTTVDAISFPFIFSEPPTITFNAAAGNGITLPGSDANLFSYKDRIRYLYALSDAQGEQLCRFSLNLYGKR